MIHRCNYRTNSADDSATHCQLFAHNFDERIPEKRRTEVGISNARRVPEPLHRGSLQGAAKIHKHHLPVIH